MSTEITTIATYINEFRAAFSAGLDSIVEAANIYVRALDDNPRNADKFRKAFSDTIPAKAWSGFEAVGRKWMHPKLIMGGMADGKKATAVKRLPYSMQERVFSRDQFDLLCEDGSTLQIDMMEATHEQVAQLCDGSTIRTIDAQRSWKEAKAAEQKAPPQSELLPYVVKNGTVSFRRATTLTRHELKHLLQDM